MNDAIRRGQKRIEDYRTQQAQVDKLIASSPLVAADLSDLTRDVDLIKAKVASLVSKKAEAEITADLETRSGPSQFRVLESAQPPSTAASPNRGQALLLAVIAALALGSAIALGKELSDRTLRSETEVGDALSLPVLACVPEITGGRAVAQIPMQTQAEA